MKPDLEPAKNVLRSFYIEYAQTLKIQDGISAPILTPIKIEDRSPELDKIEFVKESDTYIEKENAYRWLFASAKHYRSLLHRPKLPPIPEYYQQPALPVYLQWKESKKEFFNRENKVIPPPKDVSLHEYLKQLSDIIYNKNEQRVVWTISLRSFMQFLREDTDIDQHGPLEVIFPREMYFESDSLFHKTKKGNFREKNHRYILRLVDKEIAPIDIFAASDIIKNLAKTVLEDRPNTQHSAAEALGFAWLCIAIGSSRLMTLTKEELIYKLPVTSLKKLTLKEHERYFQPECFISIPTYYGSVDIPISLTLYDFLLALPRSDGCNTIFSKAPSVRLRAFYNKGVKLSDRTTDLGKITFRTLTSHPHEKEGYRPIIKSSR